MTSLRHAPIYPQNKLEDKIMPSLPAAKNHSATAQNETAKSETAQAVANRRTFAIISHPDAGKTTLSEKLLLQGGAIHLAGAVKARGNDRRARSDWMKIEQQRGISVTTSVMTFRYNDLTYTLLDTPGHEDFSEDTYRTLSAVDTAIMVIDAAKGIEPQTQKLFEICRLRDIPIITFINKLDRESRDPFDLMEEISDKLALDTAPITWPVGAGLDFRGCYDLIDDRLVLMGESRTDIVDVEGLGDRKLADYLESQQIDILRDEAELAKEACPQFDHDSFLAGHLSPVFFGSALHNFGVQDLLAALGKLAPAPRPQPTEKRLIQPDEDKVVGFVFKVQANMDRNHRDRIAFVRLCAGKFQRGMKLKHIRSQKMMAIANPILFFAQERELVEQAFAGDIIGIPNHGTLRVGDTLSQSEDIRVTGLPNFAPEILQRIRPSDPMKAKHLQNALLSLAEEGVTQIFKPLIGSNWLLGVVGQLQLDVITTRMDSEYKISVALEPAPFETARWVYCDDAEMLKQFTNQNGSALAEDGEGQLVFLARNAWELNHQQQKWPQIRFDKTRERA